MFLEIITPDKKLFSGEVDLIKVPGTKGSFEILKNHAPIISTLEAGNVKVVSDKGGTEFFRINGGVIEVKHNKIVILAEKI